MFKLFKSEKRKGVYVMNYNKMITARKASFCIGLNIATLKQDIELGRLQAIRNCRGHYQIRVCDVLDYADYLHHSNRNVLLCPMGVIKHRIRYAVFGIYD